MTPGSVQIAEAVHFRRAEKSDIHAALLQQRHHIEHLTALRGVKKIGRIAHGVKKFKRRCFADDAIFEKSHSARSVRTPGNQESQHRQTHSHEYQFPVADFPGRRRNHQFAKGVTAARNFRFRPSRHDKSMLPFGETHFGSVSCISPTNLISSGCGRVSFKCSAYFSGDSSSPVTL